LAEKLSRDEVLHVALLARLGLTEKEVELFREQLSKILEYMEVLFELDVEAIPPTAQVVPLQNVMRPDQPRPSLDKEQVLANAPARAEDFFQVRVILEEAAEAER